MINKRNKNNKFKFRKLILKKCLATVLASTLGISSGAALVALNSGQNIVSASGGLSYMNDGDINNQTYQMMDDVNNLIAGCYMNAEITALTPTTYAARLKFTIPGYDANELKIIIKDRNLESGFETKEYQISSGYLNPTPSAYVPNLAASVYDVRVYNRNLSEENFVCKAMFVVVSTSVLGPIIKESILDSTGAETDYQAIFRPRSPGVGPLQYCLAFPESAVPFSAQTVKTVFFPTDRDGAPVDIDKSLYDYSFSKQETNGSYLYYFPIAYAGKGAGIEYEVHFYKDEVKSENFIGKITELIVT